MVVSVRIGHASSPANVLWRVRILPQFWGLLLGNQERSRSLASDRDKYLLLRLGHCLLGDVVHVADNEWSVVSPGGHVQCLVKLPAIGRKLKRAAHLISARIFFVANQAVPVKLSSDLLMIFIFGFLQFPSVGHERPFTVAVIHQIDFRAGHRERDCFRWREKLPHFLPLFIAFAPTSAIAAVTTAGISGARPAANATIAAIRPSGLLPPLARVVALFRVELPGAKNRRARRGQRRRIRTIRCWRSAL